MHPFTPGDVLRAAAGLVCLWMLAVGVFAGCATYGPPAGELGHTAWGEATEEAKRLDVLVRLHNPNDAPLQIHEVHYDVYVGASRVFRGRRAARATLAPHDDREVSLPVVLRPEHAASLRGSATYEIRGQIWYLTPDRLTQILVDAGLQNLRTRFSVKGHVTDGTAAIVADEALIVLDGGSTSAYPY